MREKFAKSVERCGVLERVKGGLELELAGKVQLIESMRSEGEIASDGQKKELQEFQSKISELMQDNGDLVEELESRDKEFESLNTDYLKICEEKRNLIAENTKSTLKLQESVEEWRAKHGALDVLYQEEISEYKLLNTSYENKLSEIDTIRTEAETVTIKLKTFKMESQKLQQDLENKSSQVES